MMKVVLVLALILLLVLIALPMAMGYGGQMGDCPACTSAKGALALGLCAAIVSLVALVVSIASSRLSLVAGASRQLLLTTSIFRPPRSA